VVSFDGMTDALFNTFAGAAADGTYLSSAGTVSGVAMCRETREQEYDNGAGVYVRKVDLAFHIRRSDLDGTVSTPGRNDVISFEGTQYDYIDHTDDPETQCYIIQARTVDV